MEAVATRTVPRAWSETLGAAAIAAVSAIAIATLAPPGGDTAAHLYRTELVRDGVFLWDNLWFAGHYPLASYSLLYYLPAALVGNVVLVVAATIASAALFAALAAEEWGAAARWPARVFAVLVAGPLYTGTYTYALGVTALLATLRLLQLERRRSAVAAAALTLALSPLAFAFLCIVSAAIAVARRPPRRELLAIGGALTLLALLQLVLLAAFPSDGRYPYSRVSLAAVVAVGSLGASLAARSERGRTLAAFLGLWVAVNVAAFVLPSPFGDNLSRLRAVVFAVVLVAALLAQFRPRWLAAAALVAAAAYNFGPDLSALPKRIDDAATAEREFWAPAAQYLLPRTLMSHRVEVVPTFGHWEAYWLPREGVALARGWYRQLDIAQNPELYERSLDASAYRAWLRRMGVRYVVLPHTRLGAFTARDEAELLRSGRAELEEVLRTRDWTIYEFDAAPELLSGPGTPELTWFGHDEVRGRVSGPGTYRLLVRWTPYWRVASGDVCLARARDGITAVRALREGAFSLRIEQRPSAVFGAVADDTRGECSRR